MRVLVIPDVHLKPYLFYQALELMEKGEADQAVCLMDIPDDWNREYDIGLYVQTYDAAIEFAKKYPDTLWAYGNHDLCYMWNERESGYSAAAARTVQEKLLELHKALPEGNEIRYIQKIDNVLFCHGGVPDYFVKSLVSPSEYQYERGKMYKPRKLLQVVGHTPVEKIYRKENVISCDVFSTYRDGRPIGTQEFPVIDTETWEFWGVRCV